MVDGGMDLTPETRGGEEQGQGTSAQPLPLELKFHGSAGEYFRIWIVNLCLTLLSVGIFSAWAKVRKKRYFYSHTTLDSTPFEYRGQPVPILKGRVIAAAAFLLYYASSRFFTSLLPYVMVAGLILAPWVISRSAAFNARYSAYRNMTFHFEGRYVDALKAIYVWGIIPVMVLGIIFDWKGVFGVAAPLYAVSGLAFPWWLRRLKHFIVSHTSYGGKKGEFSATGGQFFKVYFSAGLVAIGFGILAAILVAVSLSFMKTSRVFFVVAGVPAYAVYVLAYAYVQAHISNLVWNHTRLGPLRFRSTLLGRGMAKLYLVNALGIIASLGLLIPWAVMRTLRYRAEHMQVVLEGDLSAFRGAGGSAVPAAGAELGDFFDVDVSL